MLHVAFSAIAIQCVYSGLGTKDKDLNGFLQLETRKVQLHTQCQHEKTNSYSIVSLFWPTGLQHLIDPTQRLHLRNPPSNRREQSPPYHHLECLCPHGSRDDCYCYWMPCWLSPDCCKLGPGWKMRSISAYGGFWLPHVLCRCRH